MKQFCILLVIILNIRFSYSQSYPGQDYVNDFNIIVKSLQELHPILYTNISEQKFDYEVNEIRKRLMQTTSKLTAVYIIQELFYKLGNSHAGNISAYGDLGVKKALPFNVWIIDHSLYIKNYPADTSLNGLKINTIENTDVALIIDSLKIFFPTDGVKNVISYNLQPLFNNLYGAFCSQKDTFTLNTEKGVLEVPAVQKGTEEFTKLVLKNGEAYFGEDRFLKKIIAADYGYYKFIGFQSKFNGYEIEDEFNSFIREVNEKKIKNIIIDLRYNSGGDPYLCKRMTSYLTDHPFKTFERIYLTSTGVPTHLKYMNEHNSYRKRHLKSKRDNDLREVIRFEKGLKLIEPSPIRFKGNIYIITGSVTQSASTMMCKYLKEQPNVTFVGSETIGAINYFWANELCTLTLPALNTSFGFGWELIELKKDASKFEKPIGLIPDHKIEYTIEDRLRKKDKEMEFILSLIRK